MQFKFTATIVDAIEKEHKEPIGNIVTVNTVNNMVSFIMKAGVNEDGRIGFSRNIALKMIDDYLVDNDMDALVLDITEALIDNGFLSRDLSVDKMRQLKTVRAKQAMDQIDEALKEN